MVVTDPPAPPACTGETEGELREKLAAYFLSAPPLDRQDDEQKRRHKAALRRLLRLENRSILQAAGLPRPLSQGDLAVLLRAACRANAADLVAVSLSAGTEAFILTVTGERPPAEAEALAVAEETARLHKGGLAVCSGTVGLSLSTSLPGDAGLYVAPTPTQLLRDTLSAVQVGLYSSLG